MSTIRELAFDWLFNASIQIGLFAIVAVALSPFIAKAKAKYQHCFYLAIFALCLAAPVFNTLWQTRPSVAVKRSQQQLIQGAENTDHPFWDWNGHTRTHEPTLLLPAAKTALLVIWQVFFLYQLIHFGRGIYRVRRLRKNALLISPSKIGTAGSMIKPQHRIALLESTAIDDPVTVGVFHPAIILPSKVLPALDEQDLAAILAHEYAHIRRKDFLVLILCQLSTLPIAWHPGIKYLMSKISQTRELACDEYAAVRLGKRTAYARSLLRLASLCLQTPRSNAMGLGIFDGDNLEDRIMMLTEKRTSLTRAGLIGLALTTSILFGSSTVLARAVSLQEASASTNSTQKFAGTWHWMFQGRSFSTMVLVQNGSVITGTLTSSRIKLGDDGELSNADPGEDTTPSPVTAKLEGNELRVTLVGTEDHPFGFIVTLKDATHAEIRPFAPPTANMKPIQAVKVN